MEKSVDEAPADFVGSDGFGSGCCISAEDGIPSAETVAGGDWDADRSISTDKGDVGELVDFLVVVVGVTDSSNESRHTVDCISIDHAAISSDKVNLCVTIYVLHIHIIVKRDYHNTEHWVWCMAMAKTNRLMAEFASSVFLYPSRAVVLSRCRGSPSSRASSSTRSLSVNAPSRRSIGRLSLPGRCTMDAA